MPLGLSAARPLLRQSVPTLRSVAARRLESTTASKAAEGAKDGAAKAQQVASEYQAKAQEGLSRVTSAAGPAIAGAAKGLSSALGKVGGRTGRVIGFVERQVPFVIYYSRVGLEVSKLVFRGQSMSPPSAATFQTYWQSALKRIQNPSSLFSQSGAVLQSARNVSRAQFVTAGVVVAELLGFFTVGEMIGRFKLIGYHGDTHAAHH